MLADPVMYYGRFLNPRTRDYALYSVSSNVERAIAYLGVDQRPMRILDLGSGLGMQALIFARYGADVVGVDLDPRCATLAEKRRAFFEERWGMPLKARFVAADFHDFASHHPSGAFDAVFSMSAFAHIPPLEITVAELARLAAPTARVFLWDKNPDYLYMNAVAGKHRDLPRPSQIRAALRSHRFRVDTMMGAGAIPSRLWVPALHGLLATTNRLLSHGTRLSFNYLIAASRSAAG